MYLQIALLTLVLAPVLASEVFESSLIESLSLISDPIEDVSPEIVFITNEHSEGRFFSEGDPDRVTDSRCAIEVAQEFRFHAANASLAQLEGRGFNRDAPTTFLMHGYTSGYPQQAWISAIVEAYTIHRSRREDRLVSHNMFVINWEHAARGDGLSGYLRAVRNIPKVATYVYGFINEKLLAEAKMDPMTIQLIGHSLGAHLAGRIGAGASSRLARIYGLDPAGPFFEPKTWLPTAALMGRHLESSDAHQVVAVHTHSAALGISKPLGNYSVFVEGGAVQPGCADGSIAKTLMSWNEPSCSHSRAPDLFTHLIDQTDSKGDCQMIAYECDDWDSFRRGHCGVCHSHAVPGLRAPAGPPGAAGPPSVSPAKDCIRVGLDWQYPGSVDACSQPVNGSADGKRLYLRTGEIQPYCIYNYQVVLELRRPFEGEPPKMSMVLQEMAVGRSAGGGIGIGGSERPRLVPNSLNVASFGNKLSELAYTQLISGSRKLGRIYHATLLIGSGLKDGRRIFKRLHVNYMSHADPKVRQMRSSRLCLLKTDMDRHGPDEAHYRYFFELCDHESGSDRRDEL